MIFQSFFILFATFLTSTDARTYVIIDEKIEKCTVDGYDPNFAIYDRSNFKIIPENDTHTFMNGTIKHLVEVKSPWPSHIHTEHFERGQWLLQAFSKNFSDFCPEFKNPVQPWYYVTKNMIGCPFPAGHELKFDMVPLELSEWVLKAMPEHYMGKWRAIIQRGIMVNGVEQLDCIRVYAHVYIE